MDRTPNHLYLMSASNAGCTDTGQDFQCVKGRKFPQKTIFQSLAESNRTWRYYYNDSAWNDKPIAGRRSLQARGSSYNGFPVQHGYFGSARRAAQRRV